MPHAPDHVPSSQHRPGLIASRREFHDALRTAFALAANVGCRDLWLCDPDFADWPLGESGVVDQLRAWAGSQRRLTLLASSFDEVARRHPRWVDWRRTWSHVVSCRINTDMERAALPTVLLAPGLISVRLSDFSYSRGRMSSDAAEEVRCREMIDAVLQRSQESFALTLTGL